MVHFHAPLMTTNATIGIGHYILVGTAASAYPLLEMLPAMLANPAPVLIVITLAIRN